MIAWRAVSEDMPETPSNGGRRAKARRKLSITHSSEAVPAWVSWRSGPLIQPARGLGVERWQWSQLTLARLEQAGKEGRLWSSQAGWVVTRFDGESLYVEWLECGPDDIDDMLRAIIDLGIDAGATEVHLQVPEVDWLTDALATAGFEVELLYLYERPL